jgi:two-component system, cell cycle sensor histidine kinase and response regulator CckA
MQDPHARNAPKRGAAPTILLADDEATARAEVARLLRGGLRCHVCEASDGRHALRVFRQSPGRIDLVLADFFMPVMDGGELAERIRDLDPQVPIVLMSAPATGEASDLLCGYRDFPFLEKPFTYRELSRVVAPILNGGGRPPGRRTSRSWRSRSGHDEAGV